MDIVVRTPHGDADVSIVAHMPTTTLGDVIAAISGQAVPRLALIDGHAIDAATLLDDAGLVRGAVVTTEPARPTATSTTTIAVTQIAGPGAGRIVRLEPGRFRFGPGRRSSADELDSAPVDHTMFEVIVEPTAAAINVTIESDAADVALDGVALRASTRWSGGTLTAGSRAFELENPARADPTRSLAAPDSDGTAAFSRPPRRRSAPERRPVIDALRDATMVAPSLWERRPGHQDAFVLPFGVTVEASNTTTVTVDLGADRALAIAGSDRVRSALARTLVVEAATLHGPADLEIVVLTSSDRVAEWDWAKWLPHVRHDGAPAIWSSALDIERWVTRMHERDESPTHPGPGVPLTVAVVGDPDLWNRRDAVLRPVLSRPPANLRLIALCDDAARAPALCTTLIAETDDGRMQLHSFTTAADIHGIRPALTERAVAVRIARALAPLVDVDLPMFDPPAPATAETFELADLLGVSDPADVVARWNDDAAPPTATVGRSDGHDVEVDLADDVTVVVGPSMGDAGDVAATWLLSQCAHRSPDDLWVVPLALASGERSELWWRLPHATTAHDSTVEIEPQRLLARLRTVLADVDGPSRIVLVAETGAANGSSADVEMLASLADAARATDGLSMLVVSDRPGISETIAGTLINVERREGTGGPTAGRIATTITGANEAGQPWIPLQPPTTPGGVLDVRPAVIGRALTPLERRLERRRTEAANTPSPALEAAFDILRRAASQYEIRSDGAAVRRVAIPPPMPTLLDLDEFFDVTPGDGVPLGLADDPEAAGVRTQWWEPGSGSLLLYGSRRSGVEQVLTTVAVGIADRFSGDDVRMIVVEASAGRRRALAHLGQHLRIVDPDHVDDVADALGDIEAEVHRQHVGGDVNADLPRLVVSISDLAQLRRHHAEHELGARIDDVLATAAQPNSGVDIVAYTAELDGAGPLASATTSRLVGASSNHAELSALGVDEPGELDGVLGRCRAFPGGHLVQLAMSDVSAEMLFERRRSEG
jgi:S-DNA-T family DNA segregation ATPase FtsK/SpoIIIE